MKSLRLAILRLIAILTLIASSATAIAQVGDRSAAGGNETASTAGPYRLRNTQPGKAQLRALQPAGEIRQPSAKPPRPEKAPSEFALYVSRLAGNDRPLQRIGDDWVDDGGEGSDSAERVSADYAIKAGDELLVSVWGSVDAELNLDVDREGRITIPRAGPVKVSGLKVREARAAISKRLAQVFKNFDISVSLGKLHSIRIHVTGYVERPGVYTVSSLATPSQAILLAGGPSVAGSYRNIQWRRGKQALAQLDLYDLMLKGEIGDGGELEADDVLHVGPSGPMVAVVGSVNRPALIEIRPSETLQDAVRMAGGFSSVADTKRIGLERKVDRIVNGMKELSFAAEASRPLDAGDVIRAFSDVDAKASQQLRFKRVRVEGEVARPGDYVLPSEATMVSAIAAAGGLTPQAFVFGTEFSRESVRQVQQVNYDRALRDFESTLSASGARKVGSADEAAMQTARLAATNSLLDRLRALRPSGRIVLEIPASASDLPDLLLEDGDRISIPARPNSVGVFGSVFNSGSFLYAKERLIGDYLQLSGGPNRTADSNSSFVVRANGSVVTNLASSGWFSSHSWLEKQVALPGDTLFVPADVDRTTVTQNLKDWAQIFSQFGLGIAAIRSITN